MDKKFLNKVVYQLVNETRIDYEGEELYVPFTTQSFHSYFPSLFRSYGSFNSHCKDVYGLSSLEIKYVWDKWEVIILDKIRDKGSINESTGINKKFLDKVVDQLVSETRFESREGMLYWGYPFSTELTTLKPYFSDNNDSIFHKHCRNVYGLNEQEIGYVRGVYIEWLSLSLDIPKDTIYFPKDNLNEARISSKLNSDFLDEVVQYLIDNTVIIPDKTMSVSHEKSKRGKIIIPVKDSIELEYYYNTLLNPSIVLLFSDEMENVYGLDPGLEIKYVWDKYKKHIFSNI